ncbi:MAG: DUF5686 and carboxypeptidase regulatory-like domain-containing protein [Saprospiraceae bacterium]|nr:DUF5686 and carboxypeptidase regulatory-like domain-containing protein [Saprospiraceae bacterium]
MQRLHFLLLLLFPLMLSAQWTITGAVTDIETGEAVPFATIVAGNAEEATTTDADGHYEFNLKKPYPFIRIEAIGYSPIDIRINQKKDQVYDVKLQPAVYEMQEITVKPKRYTNKDNPAVELIRLVVDNRDKNRVSNLPTFQEEQYEKVVIGFGNIPKKTMNRRIFRRIRFLWENVDSNKIEQIDVVPLFVQENVYDFYSQDPPSSQQKLTQATKSVRFHGFMDDKGIDKGVQYLYQPIDIYDPNILLLTNKFPSPISNTAPLLYRYYPVDTIEQNGHQVVKLEFYPRNKYDMYLQGELYVALDSTYPVTGIRFTINPQANLNWVQHLTVEQRYEQQPSGQYMIAQEDFRMYFGITSKGMGVFSQRFVDHRNILINEPLPDDPDLFTSHPAVKVENPEARASDSLYWSKKGLPLTPPEEKAYANMDSLIHMPWFIIMTKVGRLLTGGYIDVAPGVEVGPLPTFVALNDVEDVRLRIGARTRPTLSERWQVGASASYGFGDERWKFGGNFAIATGKTAYHRFPFNRITGSMEERLALPGQNQSLNNTLGTSITRGANDRLMYTRLSKLTYEREFESQFSFQVGLEQETLEPAGALTFTPADGVSPPPSTLQSMRSVVLLRYAPGENIYQGTSGARSRISYQFIGQLRYAHSFAHVPGGQFDYDDIGLLLQKFTNVPPFGYNSTTLEAGAILGSVPYPFLVLHRANQSYFYQSANYNLMNFLEFVSDRYVALTVNQYFNGFFVNKIPLIKRLHLREVLAVKVLFGGVSAANRDETDPDILQFPRQEDGTPLTCTLEKEPYIEASIGISNIFKVFRIDVIRRFTYLDHPGAPQYGIKGSFVVEF